MAYSDLFYLYIVILNSMDDKLTGECLRKRKTAREYQYRYTRGAYMTAITSKPYSGTSVAAPNGVQRHPLLAYLKHSIDAKLAFAFKRKCDRVLVMV
jgi:hypothetical protein